MSYYSIPLLAGVPYRIDVPGRLLLIDSIGASAGVDVQMINNGTPQIKMPLRKVSFRLVGNFDGVILTSAAAATIGFFLSIDDVQLGVADGSAVTVPGGIVITNTAGAPIPVAFSGTVTPVLGSVTVTNTDAAAVPVVAKAGSSWPSYINNTDAQAVPIVQKTGTTLAVSLAAESAVRPYLAAAVANVAAVAVTATVGVLIAVGATRRGLRLRNAGANAVAIGATGVTFAAAAVIIQPGEAWIETEAPGAAWYCICNTGLTSTINIQTVT
jgi:hypothetical protein